MFKFIHTADIHLDSPLRGLERHDGAPIDEIRGATRRAFVNLIDQALDEPVDFILIAGDLYDGDWKDYNTGLFFINQMGRLAKAGIRVFMVSGNHDAAGTITRSMSLPDNVTLFSAKKIESVSIQELGVVIHGRSYATASVSDNLAADYPGFVPNHFNIGLLHTALTGRAGHASYAPCSKDDLLSKGYDYWALGHVHRREVVAGEPPIIFPGNIQGRHIRETGIKSATMVTVADRRVTGMRLLEVDVMRWEVCRVDLNGCLSADAAIDAVRTAIRDIHAKAGGLPLALRVVLEGQCPIHEDLHARRTHWVEEFRGIGTTIGEVWIEKVQTATSGMIDIAEVIGEDSPLFNTLVSDSLEIGDDVVARFHEELGALQAKIPAELIEASGILDGNGDQISDLLEDVRELLISKLSQGRDAG